MPGPLAIGRAFTLPRDRDPDSAGQNHGELNCREKGGERSYRCNRLRPDCRRLAVGPSPFSVGSRDLEDGRAPVMQDQGLSVADLPAGNARPP
jgi:hypothetical protein